MNRASMSKVDEIMLLPEWDLRDHNMPYECINALAMFLDPEDPLSNDWRMLASNLGFDTSGIIRYLERKKEPTRCVIQLYRTMNELPTWQGIQRALKKMKRADAEDVLKDYASTLKVSTEAATTGLPIGWNNPSNLDWKLKDRPLNFPCLEEVSKLLTEEHPIGRDWRLLASKLKYKEQEITSLQRTVNPGIALLHLYQCRSDATIGGLYHALREMRRNDILYSLWKQGQLKAASSVEAPSPSEFQSLPDTLNRGRPVPGTARQMSEQHRTTPADGRSIGMRHSVTEEDIKSVIDDLKDMGIGDDDATRAVRRARRQTSYRIEDKDDLFDKAYDICQEYESEGDDIQMKPTSLPSVMNIEGGNVQIGHHNRIIYGSSKQKKPQKRKPKSPGGGDAKPYIGMAEKRKTLLEMGFLKENVGYFLKLYPQENVNDLALHLMTLGQALQPEPTDLPGQRVYLDPPDEQTSLPSPFPETGFISPEPLDEKKLRVDLPKEEPKEKKDSQKETTSSAQNQPGEAVERKDLGTGETSKSTQKENASSPQFKDSPDDSHQNQTSTEKPTVTTSSQNAPLELPEREKQDDGVADTSTEKAASRIVDSSQEVVADGSLTEMSNEVNKTDQTVNDPSFIASGIPQEDEPIGERKEPDQSMIPIPKNHPTGDFPLEEDHKSLKERNDKKEIEMKENNEQIDSPNAADHDGIIGSTNDRPSSLKTLSLHNDGNSGAGLYEIGYDSIKDLTSNFDERNLISKEGAFGPVYRGLLPYEGPLKGAEVAIKVLDTDGPHGIEEYEREKQIAGIKHPNILPIYCVCEQKGQPVCIVYPYKGKKDLALQIKAQNPDLTWRRRLAIAVGLCRAVDYLHTPTDSKPGRIFHRDIKSANVLLDDNWMPYLGDAGLNRKVDSEQSHISRTGTERSECGTRGYSDPVLSRNPPGFYDIYCDIYGVGKVLLELLTNVLAQEQKSGNYVHNIWDDEGYFDDDTEGTDLYKLALASNIGWPKSEDSPTNVTQEFAKVVVSCLKTRRKKRISTKDMCRKLEDLARQNGIDVSALCSVCDSRPMARIPLYCGCEVVCIDCMKNHLKISVVCPTHGQTNPIIGHNTYLISVGVNLKPGEGYERDAREMYELFTNPSIGAVPRENSHLLTGEDATFDNIEDAFTKVKDDEKAEVSTLIFYYSGHNSTTGQLSCKPRGTSIRAHKFSKLIERVEATFTLIILDCCYALTMCPRRNDYYVKGEEDNTAGEKTSEEKGNEEATCSYQSQSFVKLGKGVKMWTSSDRREAAVGNVSSSLSVFTKHVKAGLKSAETCALPSPVIHEEAGIEDAESCEEQNKCKTCLEYKCNICKKYREDIQHENCIPLRKIMDFVYSHVDKELKSAQNPQAAGVDELDYKLAYANVH